MRTTGQFTVAAPPVSRTRPRTPEHVKTVFLAPGLKNELVPMRRAPDKTKRYQGGEEHRDQLLIHLLASLTVPPCHTRRPSARMSRIRPRRPEAQERITPLGRGSASPDNSQMD